ncbi:molybdate ABC transporter substrate-binding protein [Polaromonas sp.]|uniref:molybdate ABC transporter substrate-binding protein n=1 Tax=Polaromonas sp. TaxID=1869339 RepID=UPI00286B16D1|nr:molybdate ABC transporter substrate-binding protein [Polaromonas sp.]
MNPSASLVARLGRPARLAAALLALLLAGPAQAQGTTPALVAAAANLQPVLAELVPLFERTQPGRVSVSIGSSANLVRQIQQGLPAELFLSADEDFALRLFDAGLTPDRGVVYATGRIVLLVPADSKMTLDPELKGLKAALPQVRKFAIANPELAPYGRAALQALQKLGLWPALQGRIVRGENIAQTTQYVSSGAAQAGITALSLVLAPEVAARVRYVLIPEALHAPLRQRMVLLKSAGPVARAFYDFLQSPAARAVLARYGYT